MRTLSERLLLVLLLLVPLRVVAQDSVPPPPPPPPVVKTGFIRLVNGVSQGVGALDLKVDGTAVNDEGYQLGDVTGGIAVLPGSRELTIVREGTKAGITKVNVTIDETTIIIPFAERVPASDTEPAHWAIRVLRLKQLAPQSERSATFLSVSQNPEVKIEMRSPQGEWAPVFVKRLIVNQAPINQSRGYVKLRSATEERLESIAVSDPGNYVVLLYDDPEGKVLALTFQDQKFLSAD